MEVPGKKAEGKFATKPAVCCDFCKLLNKSENAEHYCVDCDEFSCNDCYIVHKGSKITKHHKFLTKDEMPKHKLSSFEDDSCTKHTGKILEYFCKTHDIFLCSVCVTVGHKDCTTEYIEEMATEFEVGMEYSTLTDNISRLLLQIQDIKAVAVSNRHAAKCSREKFVSDVKKFRSQIDDALDAMENTSLKEMICSKEADETAIDSVSTTCDSMVEDLQDITVTMEQHSRYKQRRKLIISAKSAESRIKDYENRITDLCDRSSIRTYTFRPNEGLYKQVESFHNIGKVESTTLTWTKNKEVAKQEERKGDQGTLTAAADSFEEVEAIVNKESHAIGAVLVGNINVKHSQDSNNCLIAGGVMMDENRIAVVDRMNDSVKVADVKNDTISSYMKLTGEPWDVTCIDKGQLVVTCPDQEKIIFLHINPTLGVSQEIGVQGKCRGIVYNDNNLIVSFSKPRPVVKMLNLNGEVLQTFHKDPDGKPLFHDPYYIALDYDRTTLFVCDSPQVISMTLMGEVLREYQFGKIPILFGLAADRHGSVYVASLLSGNIYRISTHDASVETLLDRTRGAVRPHSATYCDTENKLYISHCCLLFGRGKNNAMSVFQLQ